MISKKFFAAAVIFLLAASLLIVAVCGGRYTESIDLTWLGFSVVPDGPEDLAVICEEPGIVEVSDVRVEGGQLKFEIRSLARGSTFLEVLRTTEDAHYLEKVYVHSLGVITVNSFFGRCTGGFMFPLSILILLVMLYIDRIARFRIEKRENIYRYRNILNLGLIIFMSFLILKMGMVTLQYPEIDAGISSILSSAEAFAYIALPVAFVVFVLVSLSNLNLMRREGINWRNMLGFMLGLVLCLLTVLPERMYTFLLRHHVVDIFNERGIYTHLYSMLEHAIFFVVAYLECILLATVVFGVVAARRIPAFNKDYILILGCQIRPDGTLTPLLQARADRAVDFARMQKEASGRDIVFVPTGGKGEDEVMAEADAVGRYLRTRGVPEERILTEDKSLNTYENIRNAVGLIEEREETEAVDRGRAEDRTAFSTTNYHVFRAGLIASEQGFHMEGIGSPTRRYFWINAFIREFIATMAAERKRHLKVIVMLLVGLFLMVAQHYISVLL